MTGAHLTGVVKLERYRALGPVCAIPAPPPERTRSILHKVKSTAYGAAP